MFSQEYNNQLKIEEVEVLNLPHKLFTYKHELPSISCIYFLIEDDAVIYVGRTINLKKRWSQHHLLKQQIITSNSKIAWLICKDSDLYNLELKMISHYNPKLNIRIPRTLTEQAHLNYYNVLKEYTSLFYRFPFHLQFCLKDCLINNRFYLYLDNIKYNNNLNLKNTIDIILYQLMEVIRIIEDIEEEEIPELLNICSDILDLSDFNLASFNFLKLTINYYKDKEDFGLSVPLHYINLRLAYNLILFLKYNEEEKLDFKNLDLYANNWINKIPGQKEAYQKIKQAVVRVEPRDKFIRVNFTSNEYELIKELASQSNLSLDKFIRSNLSIKLP